MIDVQDLTANFAGVVSLRDGISRCQDETPKSVYYYYVRTAEAAGAADLLMVSEDQKDDGFALDVLASLPDQSVSDRLLICGIQENKHHFSNILFASPTYHHYFKGVLDTKRDNLMLCIPIHRCEFSGKETVDEFFHMRRHTIATLDWKRDVSPKIVLRFDNPRTGGGAHDDGVLVKHELLVREIANLNGVGNGFIECQNWQGKTIEILSPQDGVYLLIRDRDDSRRETSDGTILLQKVWDFLTSSSVSTP